MSVVSEAVGRRVTLGYLADRYGLELDPSFATGVTVTSMADDIESVRPGGLYAPADDVDLKRLEEARARGAYAVLMPAGTLPERATADAATETGEDGSPAQVPQIPLLAGDLDDRLIGEIAADLAGTPANALAVFAVSDDDPERCERHAASVASFLHILGNPVGLISASGSKSLERDLDVQYPLGILDIQQLLSVCVEDGAAAIVFALDERTLTAEALSGVNVDVIGLDSAADSDATDSDATDMDAATSHVGRNAGGESAQGGAATNADDERTEVIAKHGADGVADNGGTDGGAGAVRGLDTSQAPTISLPKLGAGALLNSLHADRRAWAQRLSDTYGFIMDGQTHVTAREAQSDMLAAQAPAAAGDERARELSLSIAMAMAAGVRKSNIRSALRVSHELNTQEEHNA